MQPAWPANSMAVKKRWLFSPTHEPTTAQWWSNLSCAPRSGPLKAHAFQQRQSKPDGYRRHHSARTHT